MLPPSLMFCKYYNYLVRLKLFYLNNLVVVSHINILWAKILINQNLKLFIIFKIIRFLNCRDKLIDVYHLNHII